MANDTKTVSIKVPVSFMATNTIASTDYVVDLAKSKTPADLAAFLIEYGFRVIVQRATAGIKNGDVDGARKACRTRVDNLYTEDFGAGAGGARLEPTFRVARDFVARALKVKPADIPDWDFIVAKLGAEKTDKIRAWAKKQVSGPDVTIDVA